MKRSSESMLSTSDFRDQIIDRGIDYYERGLVTDLIIVNTVTHAIVNSYDVYIGPESCYCSCPCYKYRENCKHLYALLLKMEDETKPYDKILAQIDKLIVDPSNRTELSCLGTELLDIVIENEIYDDSELLDKICTYEPVLKEMDLIDIFGLVVDHLLFVPEPDKVEIRMPDEMEIQMPAEVEISQLNV